MTSPDYGIATEYTDGIRRVIARNAGPMTHWGTNTWLVGNGEVAVIDPGPLDQQHLEAILTATNGQRISHILVTHAHADHSGLAGHLSNRTGAPIVGFGPPEAGRSDLMDRLARTKGIGGGEGVDHRFSPHQTATEGDRIAGSGWEMLVRHIPGHFAGHLGFQIGDVLFSGDHVMDWSTSLVSPPDGDVGAFLKTSARLSDLNLTVCLTGHGNPVENPAKRLAWLIAHRKQREAAILSALASGIHDISLLTVHVYADTPAHLHPAASRNILAHLIDLYERNVISATPEFKSDAEFHLI